MHDLVQVGPVEKVVGGGAVRPFTEPGGRIRLRVEVHDESALAGLGQTGREVDRGRRLSDAALLIRDRVDASGHAVESSVGLGRRPRGYASGRFRAIPGRRGNRSGVGPSFANRSSVPPRSAGVLDDLRRPPRRAPPRRGRGPGLAAIAYRISVPPGRTSGRHHSAATGCGASARASTAAYASRPPPRACSSARAQTTSTFGKPDGDRRQKRALRCRTTRAGRTAGPGGRGKREPGRAPARADIDHGARVDAAGARRARRRRWSAAMRPRHAARP